MDGSGNAYVTGRFSETVDFDPGSGVDNHTSNGQDDVFLSKLDSSGDFVWARTWGGNNWVMAIDSGNGVAVDSSGSVYVTGQFWNTVDFDPGSGIDNHTSNGWPSDFLSKFDSSGTFQWAETWGGGGDGVGLESVAADGAGSVYVTGDFRDTVDFDPSSDVDNHISNGNIDVFLVKFLPDGSW